MFVTIDAATIMEIPDAVIPVRCSHGDKARARQEGGMKAMEWKQGGDLRVVQYVPVKAIEHIGRPFSSEEMV